MCGVGRSVWCECGLWISLFQALGQFTEWEFSQYDFHSSICERHSLRLHVRRKNSLCTTFT